MSIALSGLSLGPVVSASNAPKTTCEGPTKAATTYLAHIRQHGIKAQEALYNRSLIGCIPLSSNGRPQSGLIQRALRQQNALQRAESSLRRGVRPTLSSIGNPWSTIGPAPIGTGAGADSGRILSMTYDTDLNGGTLFIGTAQAGVWSSTTPFTSWTTHTDTQLTDLAIDSVAFGSSPSTIYAGTGEQAPGYDALYGGGVYKSTDGGVTWSQLTAFPGGRNTVSKIVVSSTGTVYVGIGSGFGGGKVYISIDGGTTWNAGSGVAGTDSFADLAIDSSDNVYGADAAALATQANSGVYKCASPCTSASTWTLLGGGTTGTNSFPASGTFDNMKITAANIVGGTALYAILSNNAAVTGPPAHSAGTTILGIWRLLPGSATWTQVANYGNSANYENQAWYDIYIWADPTDTTGNTVYFGLSDIYKSVSAAGGTPTWTNLTNVYNGGVTGVHPDQHAITSIPGARNPVFFGNDGGAWQSINGGASFTDVNGNLSTLQFYGGALGTKTVANGGTCTSNCDPTAISGGFQDNGTAQTTGSPPATAWTRSNGFGDGGFTLIDPVNNNNRYGENADGAIANSTDGGANYNDMGVGNTCGASNFMAPMALDPTTPTTVFVGERDLCETTNATAGAPTWTDISKPGGTSVTASALSSIAVSHAGGGTTIYISDDNGNTFYTTNNGTSWTTMDTGANPAAGTPKDAIASDTVYGPASSTGFGIEVSSLAADPTASPAVVYATVNGFGGNGNHVFKWTNTGGANGTWADIGTALPDEPYDAVTVNPVTPSQIFVGGITGTFTTSNAGGTWNVLGTGLPNVQVDNLQASQDGTTLIAFTHGRSAWKLTSGPTAVRYSELRSRISHGWTNVTWRSMVKVAGFDVYSGKKLLNKKLITSRTGRYSFSVHRVVHNLRLLGVPLI